MFNNKAIWFSYHWLLDIKHMVIVTYIFRGNLPLVHRLLFPISSNRSFICSWWASCGPLVGVENSPNWKCFCHAGSICHAGGSARFCEFLWTRKFHCHSCHSSWHEWQSPFFYRCTIHTPCLQLSISLQRQLAPISEHPYWGISLKVARLTRMFVVSDHNHSLKHPHPGWCMCVGSRVGYCSMWILCCFSPHLSIWINQPIPAKAMRHWCPCWFSSLPLTQNTELIPVS